MTSQVSEKVIDIVDGPPLIDIMEVLFFNPGNRLFFGMKPTGTLAVELLGVSRPPNFYARFHRLHRRDEKWILQVRIRGMSGDPIHSVEVTMAYCPNKRVGQIDSCPELVKIPSSSRYGD